MVCVMGVNTASDNSAAPPNGRDGAVTGACAVGVCKVAADVEVQTPHFKCTSRGEIFYSFPPVRSTIEGNNRIL